MKDIKGYEGLYAVTSCGKVWSYRRKIFLSQRFDKDGYPRVDLYKNRKVKTFFIHRLVAEAYIPNPDNLPQINHKDEIRTNNYISNLEWCSAKYNVNYGTRTERAMQGVKKPVRCIELDTVYESQKAAAEALGIVPTAIGRCCRGKQLTAGGYHFESVKRGA